MFYTDVVLCVLHRYLNARLVWEEIDEARINFDDVDELFSKVPIENTRKSRLSKNKSPPKQVDFKFLGLFFG